MKHGSEYAKRIKRLFAQWVKKHGRAAASEPTDPIEQLVVAILSQSTSRTRAEAVFKRLRLQMVDLNELRVTPPMELGDEIGDELPQAKEKAQQIVDALNAVRRRQDALDLSFLRQRGRREAREYLEALEGVNRAVAASVVLFSLGGHAIPVDDLTMYVLRKEDLVEPTASPEEVQAFLERNIAASDGPLFAELLSRYVNSKAPKMSAEKMRESLYGPAVTPASAPVEARAPARVAEAEPAAENPPSTPAKKKTSKPARTPAAAKRSPAGARAPAKKARGTARLKAKKG